jgi:hypothetical protein
MKIIIAARPYRHNSFGIVVLHRLYKTILELGHECRLIFFEGDGFICNWYFSENPFCYEPQFNNLIKFNNLTNFFEETKEGGLIIYPEIINGNPLQGKNIVRYLLNKEGALKKWGMNAGDNDFILVFSKLYRDQFHASLFYPPDISWVNEKFMSPGTKDLDLTYLGKGIKYGVKNIIKNTIQISREWPSDKLSYIDLLGRCRYFFSFDTLSSTNTDAMLAGAVPFIFEFGPFKLKNLENSEIPFYSGKATYDLEMNITKLDFDELQFRLTRSKAINSIKMLEENFQFNTSNFITRAISHFEI